LNKGYKFVVENFHSRFGEVDLICEDGDVLVFVEVKTRTNVDYGNPEDAITRGKMKRLRKAAEIFVVKNPEYGEWLLRLDVVVVVLEDGRWVVRHYEGVY
jgi:putative endonuclease